tara:strand:+ start:2933 stop:3526 length:594 start_codon:yes stop_codon:yes gene_type:complete
MALDKQALEDKISALLALDTPPNAADPSDCANKISDYVDEYLADLELNAFPAPGVNPTGAAGGAPLPDPVGPSPKAEPAAPLAAAQFRIDLVAVMASQSGVFSTCGPKFAVDMASMLNVSDANGYAAAGASVCATPPDIDAAFNKGKEGLDHVEVAKELANQIHSATTSTVFTAAGAYAKALFVQTPPTPPYTSPFK